MRPSTKTGKRGRPRDYPNQERNQISIWFPDEYIPKLDALVDKFGGNLSETIRYLIEMGYANIDKI